MAYVMLLDDDGSWGALAAAGAVMRGYDSTRALEPAERGMLRTLCMARLAQSLGLGAYSAALDPGNAEYTLSTQRAGWGVLRMLWTLSESEFAQRLSGPAAAVHDNVEAAQL